MNNKFTIIAPFYNQEKNIEQFLASIYYQTYKNVEIIMIDDMSTDDSERVVDNFLYGKGYEEITYLLYDMNIPSKDVNKEIELYQKNTKANFKVLYIKNNEKRYEVENILEALKYCKDNDIILRIDPDDFLFNLMSLEILNNAYNSNDAEAIWTSHVWKGSYRNISAPMPQDVDVYKHPWVSSHLKTFRKYLINDVKDENFRRWDGKYFTRIGDQALYLPVLHKTQKRGFLDIPMYWYNIEDVPETYQTEDAKLQKQECDFLRARGFIA